MSGKTSFAAISWLHEPRKAFRLNLKKHEVASNYVPLYLDLKYLKYDPMQME